MATPNHQASSSWFERLQGTVVILTCVVLLYWGLKARVGGEDAEPLPNAPVPLAGAPAKGSAEAKAALIIYSDYECPYCGRFMKETWPEIDARYVASGKLLVAYRHLPLERIHKNATRAAVAANCAGDLADRFWEMNGLLYRDRTRLSESDLNSYAADLGIGAAPFLDCLSGAAANRVADDLAGAKALGLRSTPAFLLGLVTESGVQVKAKLVGAHPFEAFAKAIDQVLTDSSPSWWSEIW